jgi:hypothetical protein
MILFAQRILRTDPSSFYDDKPRVRKSRRKEESIMNKCNNTRSHLELVVRMVDQAIDATVDLLANRMNTMDHVVLNVTREQTLRSLQELLHAEHACQQPDAERFWRIVSSILATAISYTLASLSGSVSYQPDCEWMLAPRGIHPLTVSHNLHGGQAL